MAIKYTTTTSFAFVPLRRRLPLVGAFCLLSVGFLHLPSFLKRGAASSSPLISSRRSKFGSKATQGTSDNMEGSSDPNTVSSIVVYVTVPNREAGRKLAESIVKEKLAACVNIVPGVESVYQWQDKVQTDSEELLIIKTRQSLLSSLTEHVKANHEYEVPEVISLPITGGSSAYLEWLKNSTLDR